MRNKIYYIIENNQIKICDDLFLYFYLDLHERFWMDSLIIEEYIHTDLKENIFKLLKILKPREQEIITMYYGLKDKKYTVDQLSELFHLNKQRIKQIIHKSRLELVVHEYKHHILFKWKNPFESNNKTNIENELKEDINHILNNEYHKTTYLKHILPKNTLNQKLQSELEQHSIQSLNLSFHTKRILKKQNIHTIHSLQLSLNELYTKQIISLKLRNNLIKQVNKYLLLNNPTLILDILNIHPPYIFNILKDNISDQLVHALFYSQYKQSIIQEGFSNEMIRYLMKRGILYTNDCKKEYHSLISEIPNELKEEALLYQERLNSYLYTSYMNSSTYDYLQKIHITNIYELREYLRHSNDKDFSSDILYRHLMIYFQTVKKL